MEKVILIFAYYGYRDPVFQSAVLPYFLNFPGRTEFRFILLTFEHGAMAMKPEEIRQVEQFLASQRIQWKRSSWRSGRWKKMKKIMDLVNGVVTTLYLALRYKVTAIYSEGTVGAIISYYAAVIARKPHLIHTFEPHADYMVEAGTWTNQSWETRIARWHEKRLAVHATLLFTATNAMIKKLASQGVAERKMHRVPSCVDLIHFQFSQDQRTITRRTLNIGDQEPVLLYLGKFGGMYMAEEAFEFFQTFQAVTGGWIIILSPDDANQLRTMAQAASLNYDKLHIAFVSRQEVPAYISAADVGLVGVRQWPSKIYCSPIKTGEYLACGLPVFVPFGVSDDAEVIQERGIGWGIKNLKKNAYLEVINAWQRWIYDNNTEVVRARARAYVEEDRSITVYQNLYYQLFKDL